MQPPLGAQQLHLDHAQERRFHVPVRFEAKIDFWWLILSLPLLGPGAVLGVGCGAGDGSLSPCDQVTYLDPRSNRADLAGAPSFSVSQIAAGDPITLSIPVNQHTQSVDATIEFVDAKDPRPGGVATLKAETEGGETVQLTLEDTHALSPGKYGAGSIYVLADIPPDGTYYWDSGFAMPYVLNVILTADGGPSCRSDVPIPVFEVVGR